MDGQPAGTRPVRIRQWRPCGSPDDELDLAGRGTAARRQPVRRVGYGCGSDRHNLAGSEQRRGNDRVSLVEGIIKALAEKGDCAGVADVVGVGVHGAVQLRTDREKTQQPHQEGAGRGHTAPETG